ncbi:MAG: DUF342 domain-containing protein [Candidatus Latescibacteria bacterium]|nr:DUF342 domain-containing protein [Candidatus Latescibacterota bacterium]
MSQDPAPRQQRRADLLMWQGRPLPCFVKAVVYEAGQAAALGIKTPNPEMIKGLLEDPGLQRELRTLLRRQVQAEMGCQGISYGIDDDKIAQAIDSFVDQVLQGTGAMATAKIAQGEQPVVGEDGRLEYVRNPQGVALRLLAPQEQQQALRQVHQVKKGEVLVLRHAPVAGRPGVNVRGEPVEPKHPPEDVGLQTIAGLNTEVQAQKLLAALDGVYREDQKGRVRVVQELAVDEVSMATGDLPRSGVAAVNVLVRRLIGNGAALQTSEDVFVGDGAEPGVVEATARVRARHLLVRGQVAGRPLPASYLDGELDLQEGTAQRQIHSQLERSHLEVAGLFAAREVLGRNVSAAVVLVREDARGAALEAREEILVDGNLSGGLVVCGTRLQVAGDLGNEAGTTTRVHLGEAGGKPHEQDRYRLQVEREKLEGRMRALETHQAGMEKKSAKSAYWAAFMRGEKRVPQHPLERQLLVQFLQAAKDRQRLEQEVADARRQVADLARLVQQSDGEAAEAGEGIQVVVGGTMYPGVSLELVRRLEAGDLEKKVRDRAGHETTVGAIKAQLAEQVAHYVGLYQEGIEERQKALEQMFKGMEKKPEAPRLLDRRFQMEVVFLDPERARESAPLVPEGVVYVLAHDPGVFHLKLIGRLKEPVRQMVISVVQTEGEMAFRCQAAAGPPVPWQRDPQILERLSGLAILGGSGRAHLLA